MQLAQRAGASLLRRGMATAAAPAGAPPAPYKARLRVLGVSQPVVFGA
jgi:hypothetical protein